jgi:Tfp pilus assembly protein PilW
MSIVELIIASAIFLALSAAILICVLAGNRSYALSETNIRVQEQARRAFDSMVRELHGAGGSITAAGSQLDFQAALGYDLPVPCPNDAACWGARDQTGVNRPQWLIRYRLNGTQLVRELLDDLNVVRETRVLASDLSQLNFAYQGGTDDTVTIQLQVQLASAQLPGGAVTAAPVVLATQVRLRNP